MIKHPGPPNTLPSVEIRNRGTATIVYYCEVLNLSRAIITCCACRNQGETFEKIIYVILSGFSISLPVVTFT